MLGKFFTIKYETVTSMNEVSDLPILYSLRNCPFAMRARLALYKSKQVVELRDVVLKNKPAQMITASAKGTVPILVLNTGKVVDESLDIMLWALHENDPENLLLTTQAESQLEQILALIHRFDREFKTCLEQYKCAKRYHESNIEQCRQACEVYINDIERRLSEHTFVMGDQESVADIAILPFIRQFARVERQWYLQSPYPNVKKWLSAYLQSPLFTKVMAKHPLWQKGNDITLFGHTQ